MVVPRWSPSTLASASLAVLLLPLALPPASAAPTIVFQDDFSQGIIDSSRWVSSAGVVESAACSGAAGSSALLFNGAGPRHATTRPLGVESSKLLTFALWSGVGNGANRVVCEMPDPSAPTEALVIDYSINGGLSWTSLATFAVAPLPAPVTVAVPLVGAAAAASVQLRLSQVGHNLEDGDNWLVDDFVVRTMDVSISQTVPGASGSETVPAQDVNTPPFTVPATCTVNACNAETPLVTPAQPVPRTCAPLELVCIGPFTVPPQDFGDAPAVCDVAGVICVGPIPVPAQDVVETQAITVSVDFTGLDALADPHAGELTSIGPFNEEVPVPLIGDVPVTVCGATCPFPVFPEGETVGSMTITVTVGSESESVTIPLGSSL